MAITSIDNTPKVDLNAPEPANPHSPNTINADDLKEIDKLVDTDGDGKLSDEEIQKALSNPETAAKLKELLGLPKDASNEEVAKVLKDSNTTAPTV